MFEEEFSSNAVFASGFMIEDGNQFIVPPTSTTSTSKTSIANAHATFHSSSFSALPISPSIPISPTSLKKRSESVAVPQPAIPPLPVALAGLGKAQKFNADLNLQAALSPVMESQIVDNLVDSKLREKIRNAQNLYNNVDMLQGQLKQFVKISNSYCGSGNEWASQGSKCAQKLTDFSVTEAKDSEIYRQFGETLGEVASMTQILMEQMDTLVCQPFKAVNDKASAPELTDLQKAMREAQNDYDSTLRKLVTSKPTEGDKKYIRFGQELMESKERVEKVTKQFTNKIGQVEDALRINMLEHMCSYMYATHTFFLQGHRLLASLEPTMRQLMLDIEQEKKDMRWKGRTRDFADHRISLRIEGSLIAGRAKQGYLFKKSKSSLKGWLIRWVVVTNRQLYWYKKWKNFDHSDFIELNQSNIKVTEDHSHKFGFAITSAKVTLHLKANNEKEFQEWLTVIRNAIPAAVSTTPGTSSENLTPGGKSTTTPRPKTNAVAAPSNQPYIPCHQEQIRGACPSNRFCADCGISDPEWISVGAGVIICGDCATIHKELKPTYILKLISSELSVEEIKVISSIGNKTANEFFECNMPADLAKPNETSDKYTKYDFIKQKYVQGLFLPLVDFDEDGLCQKLHEEVEKGEWSKLIQLVAYGADVNSINTEDGFKSLLHYSVIKKNPTTVSLLLSLGAEINVQDSAGLTPLHYSIMYDLESVGRELLRRGASIDTVTADGKNAVQIAHDKKAAWFLDATKEVLAIARLDESDALYSKLTKAAKRLSTKAMRKSLINPYGLIHRPSNAEATIELVPGVTSPTRSRSIAENDLESKKLIPKVNVSPVHIPALSLPITGSVLAGIPSPSASDKKKWRSSTLLLNLPKGEQQMAYQNSPRARTTSVAMASGAPSSPLREQRHTSFSINDEFDDDDGFTMGSTTTLPDNIIWGEELDNFDHISLDDNFSPPGSGANSNNSSSEKLRTPMSPSIQAVRSSAIMDRKRGTSLGSRVDESHILGRSHRGATISGPSSPATSSSGLSQNSPREKRVTLMIGEHPGEPRNKPAIIPKDKMEKRPSAVVTPRKEKLVREESLVNIEL